MQVRIVTRLTTKPRLLAVIWIAAALILVLLVGCGQTPSDPQSRSVDPPGKPPLSPVQGPSWLGHLGSSLGETSMGKMGGSGAAPPSQMRSEADLVAKISAGETDLTQLVREPFVLTGADLYRISCQACHGANGQGAPPEINSVIPAMSALVALPEGQAVEGLQSFLEKPGPKMPPFTGFEQDELQAILTHLESLASPGSDNIAEKTVHEPAARVGEHVVEGSCHICHAAVGPGGGSMPMMSGTIPSLASFPRSYRLEALENAVRYGSSGTMGMMENIRKMPPLPYLTSQEVAAAYVYLAAYPPQP